MDEQGIETRPRQLYLIIFGILLSVVVVISLIFGALAGRGSSSQLKPLRATATPGDLVVGAQPILVTFAQLNDDPYSFLNKRIRVSGDFQLVRPPACLPYSGPDLRWSLIASDLQLDARGFEPVVRQMPAETPMTVEGIWRLYQGPLGCGKEPATDNAWYLEVTHIVQPNPLPFGQLAGGEFGVSVLPYTPNAPTPLPGNSTASEPTATATPSATPTATATATPTLTPTPTATGVLTDGTPLATLTPSATPSQTPAAGTRLPTNTPTATPTPSATPTITPTPTEGPSPTATATQPVLPTSTPDDSGYPGGGGGGSYP